MRTLDPRPRERRTPTFVVDLTAAQTERAAVGWMSLLLLAGAALGMALWVAL